MSSLLCVVTGAISRVGIEIARGLGPLPHQSGSTKKVTAKTDWARTIAHRERA